MKCTPIFAFWILLISSCSPTVDDTSPAYMDGFPYGNIPREKPNMPLSKAMNRVYEGTYDSLEVASNELFSNFKYTPLKGFDYKGGDGTLSRRDATKIIRHEGKYYVWYTHRETKYPPQNTSVVTDSIPSRLGPC